MKPKSPNKSLQATRDGRSSSAARSTLVDPACLSSGRSALPRMRNIASLLNIVCLFFFMACVTVAPCSDTLVTQPSRTTTYTNAPSQFCFPPRNGSFERDKVTEYDRQGLDVGIGYNDLKHRIAVTVFVYPISQRAPNDTLGGHFTTCKADVLTQHTGAQLISQEVVQISPAGVQHSGQHATFTYTETFWNQRQPLRSEVYLFTHGQRFVMYRATYPLDQQAVAEPAIRTFIAELAWP